MYKLIIVDDEEIVLRALGGGINWPKLDVDLIATVTNGKKALDIIEREQPEIIITDVNMPVMDGLELTSMALNKVPHAKIIILSGYDNFDYVQTAMRNKAFDYVLKPIKVEKLSEIVVNARDVLEGELAKIKDENLRKKQLKESIPTSRERYLEYILNKKTTIDQVIKQYPYLDIKIKPDNLSVIVAEAEISEFDKEKKQLNLMGIKQIIANTFKNNDYKIEVLEGYPNLLMALVNAKDGTENLEKIKYIQENCEIIIKLAQQFYSTQLSIGVGRIYEQGEYLTDSYDEALEALEYKFLLVKGKVIYYGDVVREDNKTLFKYPLEIEDRIFMAVKTGNDGLGCNLIEEFFNNCTKQEKVSPAQTKKAIFQFLYAFQRKILEWNISDDIESHSDTITIEQKLRKLSSASRMKEQLITYVRDITSFINQKKNNEKQDIIAKACMFMKKHCGEELSLDMIAKAIYLNPNYFATLFKNETGETVWTYLTRIRIEMAKELLLTTDYKNYEVAEKVGYSNSKYFVKVFKKHVKQTPYNYRINNKR